MHTFPTSVAQSCDCNAVCVFCSEEQPKTKAPRHEFTDDEALVEDQPEIEEEMEEEYEKSERLELTCVCGCKSCFVCIAENRVALPIVMPKLIVKSGAADEVGCVCCICIENRVGTADHQSFQSLNIELAQAHMKSL